MECRDVPLQIQALLDRELEPETAQALDGHLRGCAACRPVFEAEKRWRQVLDSRLQEPVEAPQSLRDLIRLRLDQIAEQDGVVPAPLPWAAVPAAKGGAPAWRQWMPMAAAAMFALGFASARFWPGAHPDAAAAQRPPAAPPVAAAPAPAVSPAASILPVSDTRVQGRLVCLFCEMEKCYGVKRACSKGMCQPALVSGEGRLITLLVPENLDTGFAFHEHMNSSVDVKGTYYPGAQAVQMASFEYRPRTGA